MSRAPKDPTVPTPPLDDRALALPPSDPVIALRVVGEDIELALSPDLQVFTLGALPSPAVHLSLPFRHVSGVHCTIQRRGNRLSITDNNSAAGLFIGDERVTGGERKAGDLFRIGDLELLALDQRLRDLRPLLLRTVSVTDVVRVDRALADIASGGRLLLIAPPGCDQAALSEAIHRVSTRRGRAFVEVRPPLATEPERVAVLRHADRGTAFLDLDELDLMAPFVRDLFGTTYHVRAVFAASKYERARRLLGDDLVRTCRTIALPALADRATEIPLLLDAIFIEELGSRIIPTREERLRPMALDRLSTKRYPRNLEDLRKDAARLYAVIRTGYEKNAAAAELGISIQAMTEWCDRIGL